MNKHSWKKPALYAGLMLGGLTFACQPMEESPTLTGPLQEVVNAKNGDIIPGQYIVRLNPNQLNFRKTKDYAANQTAMRKIGTALLTKYRIAEGNLEHVYANAIEGFSVSLSDEEFNELSKDPAVQLIEPDRIVALAPPSGKGPGGGGSDPTQETPYGINRVNGGAAYTGSAKAYVIDSGIDASHPDLTVDASAGFNAFTKGKDANLSVDGNGHGTHVAGTIAANDNDIGVIGVAAGATVVPIKVLDSRGSGSYSGVIAGVDFVTANANPGDVANMSLGGPASDALDAAVISMASAGVKVALAAGNESQDASNSSPARANGDNIYTVSAIDSSDNFASFSNFGNPPVDYAAPGVAVKSTVPGGYATYSGTSMASPHVAGILLTGTPQTDGTANGDPDGDPDPIAVK
ncbi:S8 family peptidase [Algoriphagus hitonicola]|uniref:Peptidase inhibitor I9 n=1 Tax=Algoriphagus hitonicola TaxID=435880 RepID=A0A1I2NK90_9BACT|nr:S8 family peptidase [Algoriphagus hitonicola]SFG02097.1 Peptidase inhibitor I9 [Algoriphagus hitonicola]